MINKTELIKLLGIAMEEKSMVEGKIELLGNQLRMIATKEAKMIAEAEKLKEEKQKEKIIIPKKTGKQKPKIKPKVGIK